MILATTKLESYSSLASVSTTLATMSLVLSAVTSVYLAKKESIKYALTALMTPLVGLLIILVWGLVNMMQLDAYCNNASPQSQASCSHKSLELNNLPSVILFIALIVFAVNIFCIISYNKKSTNQ